ncbi:MAG: SUMF1/EgtB/PvdO family nonheme iron enzyme [Deltaproteobacteria bacterium]|nr:SUMF1/EgtB/PvdO family nonheme iron enzyme [Deltaproteobacteria bacterium]
MSAHGPHDPLGLVGRTIDAKYRIESVSGIGGTAVVYRAVHVVWHRRVALKVMRSLGETSEAHRVLLMDQLVAEGRLLAELSERTSAIVQARDFGELETSTDGWAPYLVLEWLEGQTLDDLLEAERARAAPPRGIAAAIELLEPVARALALAHRSGVAHRDVKPGNIFVVQATPEDTPTLKIVDFGIAKVVADIHAREGGFRRTASAFTSFTPAYGAPEQFSRAHGPTGPWTDVFGLALVLYETATGEPALVGGDIAELAARVCSPAEPLSLTRLLPDTPRAVEDVFARATAVKTEDRYASLDELWDDLRHAAGLAPSLRSLSRISARIPTASMASTSQPPASSVGPEPPSLRPTTTSRRRRERATEPDPTNVPEPSISRGAKLAAALLGIAALATTAFALRSSSSASASPSAFASPSASPSPSASASSSAFASPSAFTSPSALASASPSPPSRCAEGMLLVPGGKFFMGSDAKEALDFERPAHKVALRAFCIDQTEVTVAAYKACSDEGECRRAPTENDWPDITAKEKATYDPLCNMRDPVGRAQHPINCVDWSMADAFCRARGRRLPTEAEWEFAARGPDGRTYPWGDEAPSAQLLNACGKECTKWGTKHGTSLEAMYAGDDGFAGTAPVGSFPKGASRYGVLDIVGNVWEWVSDVYAPYTADERVDPRGPESGDERVIRGGAWNGAYPAWVRPTFRYKDAPAKRSHGIGFRCASDAG